MISTQQRSELLGELAADGVVEGDVVFVEEIAQGVVEVDAGFHVVRAGGDFCGAGLGQVGFVLEDGQVGGLAYGELVAFGIEELGLVVAAGHGGAVGGVGGLEGDYGSFHVLADALR